MERVIVLTTIYNCDKYLSKCLESIKNQTYTNWVCYLLNDLSTDNSKQIAEEYCSSDSRFVLINNDKKYYQPGNYDQILRSDLAQNEDIIIEVDGDDWLATKEAFQKVINEHRKGYLITHGSFKYSDGRLGFSKPLTVNQLRTSIANATHLRSWRAKLWKAINKEDLFVNGWYAETAGDVFFMLPMLEMAGDNKIIHMKDILYIYNETNPINDHKVNILKQLRYASLGRSYNSYKKIYN
jgi:glycosyltransferase involved in cell wall biosynthesis